jgi:hypothetical protein
VRAHARDHAIAEAGEACKGQRPRPSADAQPCHLGDAAGDQRRLAVVTGADPVADTGGDGDDVLERARELDADDVIAAVEAQRAAVATIAHNLRDRCVSGGHDAGGGQSASHLDGDVGTAQRGDRGARSHHLGEHCSHGQPGLHLDALGGADDDVSVGER